MTRFEWTNVSFKIVKEENHLAYLMQYIQRNETGARIIYVAVRKELERLYKYVQEQEIKTGKYHARLNDNERMVQQNLFLRDGIALMVGIQ